MERGTDFQEIAEQEMKKNLRAGTEVASSLADAVGKRLFPVVGEIFDREVSPRVVNAVYNMICFFHK